jgi:branched-chain amino acid transport system substrate-binding protein
MLGIRRRLVLTSLGVLLCGLIFTDLPQAEESPILVGVAGPMSGELSRFGNQMRQGVERAIADINARGGLLGRPLELRVQDDHCDPDRAGDFARELVGTGVVLVVGHFCSGASIPASRVYHDSHVLQITPASSNPRLTDEAAAAGWNTVFRVYGRDDGLGVFMGSWIGTHYKQKSIAIVHDGSDLGELFASAAQQAMNDAGTHEVMDDTISAGSDDYGDLVDKLKRANVDVLLYCGFYPEAARIIRQARESGLQTRLLAGDTLEADEFSDAAGTASEGVMFAADADASLMPSAHGVAAEFQQAGTEPQDYMIRSYAAVQVWAEAAAKAGTTDAGSVASVVRTGSWATAMGALSFDAKGDLINAPYAWFLYTGGKYGQTKM